MARRVFKPAGAENPAGWKALDPVAELHTLELAWKRADPSFDVSELLGPLRALPVERQSFLVNVAWQVGHEPLSLQQPDGTTVRESDEAQRLRAARITKELAGKPEQFGPLLLLMLRVDSRFSGWNFSWLLTAVAALSPEAERAALVSMVRVPGARIAQLGGLFHRFATLGGAPAAAVPALIDAMSNASGPHRELLAGALASAGQVDEAYRALLPLLDDDARREPALRAIIRRRPGDPEVRAKLKALYADDRSYLFAQALAAVGDDFGQREVARWEKAMATA